MLRAETSGQFVHIPYKGSAPAVNDLLGGSVDMLFEGAGAVLQHIRAGTLRCLAVAHPNRLPQLPDVPTTAEAGFASVQFPVWFGLVARAETPDPIVQKLHSEISRAMSSPGFRERFSELGFQFAEMSQAEFDAFMKAEEARWTEFARAQNISIQ